MYIDNKYSITKAAQRIILCQSTKRPQHALYYCWHAVKLTAVTRVALDFSSTFTTRNFDLRDDDQVSSQSVDIGEAKPNCLDPPTHNSQGY